MTTQLIARKRIYSIDILRGIIMMIMALDHVRDYLHITASTASPTDFATTTTGLFFTRWITHFCAPIFVFLAGCSAYLSGLKKTKRALSSFLIKRGCWLVMVEVLIVTFGWTFNPAYGTLILQVIWAIGFSMILLGLFVQLPVSVTLFTGIAIICLHNLLDYPLGAAHPAIGFWGDLLYRGGFHFYEYLPHHQALMLYAILPWTGVLFFGYGFAQLFENRFAPYQRRKYFFVIGSAMLLAFTILRGINGYGDPVPWSQQQDGLFSFLSFININKYPPSLDYVLLTVGIGIIVLGFLEKANPVKAGIPLVFGRVPFFYYVLHLYLIHAIGMIIFFAEGYPSKDIAPQSIPFLFRPDHFGFGLFGVYAIWIAVLIVLYPFCAWYNRYKSSHSQWWLSYL